MVVSNKNMILCSPNDQPIAQLNGLRIDSVSYTEPLKDYKTLEFVVDKYIDIDGKYQLSNGYDNIAVYMEIYIDGLGYFQLQEPSINNDGYKESKTCVAYSIEKELEGKDLVGFLINQGTKDSMEYLATNNVDDLGFAKEYITFYNTSNKELSLMDLVLEQLPGWSIGYIDPQLKTKKLAFNEDSINIYAFLCSEVAPKAECIFVFDNTDRIINAYGKDSIGENTNVFISFRNLLKSVDIICDEDSVVTRFAVSGADNLDIRNVNFNDRRILNLDYFMREPYMAGDLVQKLQTWISYRDGKRSDYVDLTRQYLDLESKMYEIQYRLPLDGCDWEQWDSMDKESLEKNLKYYNALLTDLQVSVDPDPQYTTDADGNKTYIPWKDSSGNVDHQRYLDLLYKQTNGYGGYYTYYEVKEYIIPNIETAISNLDLSEDQKAEYNKDYETNWDLYGTVELTAKKEFYEKQVLEVLADYEKPWSELTEEEQASHSAGESAYNIQHNKYVEYKEYLGDEQTEGSLLHTLKKLNDELDSLKTQQENIGTQRTDMISDVSMSNSRFGFSSNDIIIINRLFHDTDYTNENILTTSIDTTLTTLDVQEDLYQDAISKLSECSQPQYNFTIEVENLLSIEEFKDWNSEFINGNYFMLGISDDYAVKLRLVSRSWNPCDITPDLTVEFSNMILSKDGRSDISYLFDEINRAAKNAINIGSGNAKDSLELSTEILQKLINSQAFHNAVTDITADNAEITNIVAEYIEASEIKVDKITGTEAEFDTLFSKYIDADYINARVIIAENGEFQQLSADVANLKKAVIGTSSTETGIIINLSATNAKIDSAWIAGLVAKEITVGDLKAGDIVVSDAVRIISQNENGGNLTLNGSTMQFTDKNGNVGIQIGYGNSDTPHLFIQDENGTALWTSQGITDAAISDGLIVNDMIGDTTITKEKLAFNTVETDEYGNVSINNIVANGEKFSVQYDTFKSNTESALESLSNASDSIELAGEQVFTVTNDVISPSSITISAICHNNAQIDKWFVDDVENTSYVASDKLSLTIPSSYMANRKSATIKAQNVNGTLYDIFTLYKVVDGKDGDDGSDGYTVFLTNQNESFTADTSGNITSAIIKTTEVKAYKGSEVVTPTIGTLPIVSGLTLSKSGTKITIQANTGTNLSDTGNFDIPVTVDGMSFILTFSWTKITNLSDQQYEEVVGIKEQVLANKDEIASAKLEINQNKKDIQAKVSEDVFNNTVTTLENDIEKANQGVGKWLIEIYPKSLFDSEEQSKYEMSVFTSHTDIIPDQSFLVDDGSLSHTSTYADNYIGYALTFVECDAAFSVTTKVYYNDAFNLYLNNGMECTGDSSSAGDTGVDVTINFRKGWNCLEVVWNESTGTDGFKLGTTLSELSHVISVNCYHASITGRENQVINRYAELKIDVDGITSRVEKTESDVTVLDGKTQTLDQQYSEMQQDYNGFKTTVAKTYVTQDDLDNVNVGGTNLIRNSETLQYVDYSFDGDTLATYDNGDVLTDENGDTLML